MVIIERRSDDYEICLMICTIELRYSDDQPRDEKGRFGSGNDVDKSAESGIIKNDQSVIRLGLQFFAEKDIVNQSSASLKRAMRKYEKGIGVHKEKILNPEKFVPDWNNYSESQKQGLKKHWQKEISNFEESIQNRIDELKKRGDFNE